MFFIVQPNCNAAIRDLYNHFNPNETHPMTPIDKLKAMRTWVPTRSSAIKEYFKDIACNPRHNKLPDYEKFFYTFLPYILSMTQREASRRPDILTLVHDMDYFFTFIENTSSQKSCVLQSPSSTSA